MNRKKAAFFDRDGTLIKDVSYLDDIKKIEVLPGVVELCQNLQQQNYLLFVVTNQSGVARGYFDEAFVQKTHAHLADIFAVKGVTFAKFYYCPHHPEFGHKNGYAQKCSCRKPSPGMLFRAAQEYDLNLSYSLMFGDRELDFQAGVAAGCASFWIQDVLKKYVKDM